MSLALSSKQGVSFADIQTATTVAVYLGDFVDFIGGVSRGKRNEAANAYVKNNPLKTNNDVKAVELMDKMEISYKNEAKAASWKTKLRYKFGEDASAKMIKLTALGAACAVGGVLTANGMNAAAVPVLVAGLIATADDRKMSDEEKADVKKYADAKHALFALKKMKKALTPKVGGDKARDMFTALNLKKQSGR